MNEDEVKPLVEKIKVAIYLDRDNYYRVCSSVLFDLVEKLRLEVKLNISTRDVYNKLGDAETGEYFYERACIYDELLKDIHKGMTTREDS